MSRGIAKSFVKMFPRLSKLKSKHLRVGTAVPFLVNGRLIYSLITKPLFWTKPVLVSLLSSLVSMRDHVVTNNVLGIRVPRLGGGLDGLDFDRDVRPIIYNVFSQSSVDLYIHSLPEIQSPRYASAHNISMGNWANFPS